MQITYSLAVCRANSLLLLGHDMTLVQANGNADLGINHIVQDFAKKNAKSTDQLSASSEEQLW